jgi:hypothetical protein
MKTTELDASEIYALLTENPAEKINPFFHEVH